MARYQLAITRRSQGWEPMRPDDVPPCPEPPRRYLPEAGSVFEALRQAVAFNEREGREDDDLWAVVVDRDSAGHIWPDARIVTPMSYKVTPIWWPEGWEPSGPRDVPNCGWKAKSGGAESAANYREAENTVLALNRQCIDQPGATWYVVVAVENEPVSTCVTCDASGTETTVQSRQLHVIRPEQGGHGNCAHCPAHNLACASSDWSSQVQTITAIESRSLRTGAGVV